MTSDEAMNTIEGPRFATLTNLASNLKTFLRIVAQQPEVEALSRAVLNEPARLGEVLQRAEALAALRAEDEQESEGDAALAAYLWLVSNQRRDLARRAGGNMRDWKRFFWARKLAEELKLAEGDASGNG